MALEHRYYSGDAFDGVKERTGMGMGHGRTRLSSWVFVTFGGVWTMLACKKFGLVCKPPGTMDVVW